MKPSRRVLLLLAMPLFATAVALAETWVAVGTHSEVDTDSIHRADDGLVHYMDRDPPKVDAPPDAARQGYEEAFDCQNMISFVGLDEPDWQAKGKPINPNTHGSDLMDFVCSRAPQAAPEAAPGAEEPTPPQP